ncbi:hypothetical protein DSM106972_027200 [Dulcicalothrix desertica PCC 7102]|uniref:Uncharacterized protein n=1 Tax=Dulcicalothrix desertica PCC 7102 TaxID=232991 RepID=A0A433VK07_9CYAN|nr:alpha-xenorhabdolysin family binary toxin subunit A [Dulcicalothrix desertica]RUT06463.1 hypothetical protein DSM106972_027200 [Dulcicalothrix desertica PCC 7102]TWH62647.1 hemolytic enterotoxin HBL [Dulcicalothrix desertica PCC 7102]
MTAAIETIDIGPKQLDTAPETSGFIIASPELLAVQLFVANALELPITPDKMKFEDIREAYKLIHNHCSEWQDDIYPGIVSLATHIYDYGTSAEVIYDDLKDLAIKISTSKSVSLDSPEVQNFYALVDDLIATAKDYEQKAIDVSNKVSKFNEYCKADDKRLDELFAIYKTQLENPSPLVKELLSQKKAQEIRLQEAMDEYHHCVVVAATTPTYAWIPFAGWIAGGVVAGVYADRAVKAKKKAEDAAQQIADLSARIAVEDRLRLDMEKAKEGVENTDKKLEAALEALGTIKSAWIAIAEDLTNLRKRLDIAGNKEKLKIASTYIKDAGARWGKLAVKADQYRMRAYANFLPKTA